MCNVTAPVCLCAVTISVVVSEVGVGYSGDKDDLIVVIGST